MPVNASVVTNNLLSGMFCLSFYIAFLRYVCHSFIFLQPCFLRILISSVRDFDTISPYKMQEETEVLHTFNATCLN